nr:MAG TPA: hypothetical protein [Caudoviricetes sp.]
MFTTTEKLMGAGSGILLAVSALTAAPALASEGGQDLTPAEECVQQVAEGSLPEDTDCGYTPPPMAPEDRPDWARDLDGVWDGGRASTEPGPGGRTARDLLPACGPSTPVGDPCWSEVAQSVVSTSPDGTTAYILPDGRIMVVPPQAAYDDGDEAEAASASGGVDAVTETVLPEAREDAQEDADEGAPVPAWLQGQDDATEPAQGDAEEATEGAQDADEGGEVPEDSIPAGTPACTVEDASEGPSDCVWDDGSGDIVHNHADGTYSTYPRAEAAPAPAGTPELAHTGIMSWALAGVAAVCTVMGVGIYRHWSRA